MNLRFDTLVIGGGVAGVAAALAARAGGRSVGLVRAAPGVSALAAGAWVGPLPERLGEALARAGLPIVEAAAPLPHPTGRLVACGHAAPAHGVAPAAGTLVCGIEGLPGFHAPILARLWGAAASVELEARTLVAGATPAGGWSPVALAARLDRECGPLAEALARAVRETGATRVILPAVLGLERADAVRAALTDAAGVPVGEALGVPPSLPGWRLDRALDAVLVAAKVEVVRGRVVGRETAGRRVGAVVAHALDGDPAEPLLRLEAGHFVLATGKFLAGGIRADDRFEEPALGCPVRVEHLGQTFEAPDRLALTHPDRRDDQPLLRVGVHTDDRARPVDRRGDVVYENVTVAGSVRAGHDPATLGLGFAAADGWRAGELAVDTAPGGVS